MADLDNAPEELETPPEAPEMTDAEALAELAATPTAQGVELNEPVVITEQDEFESVAEGEEVTPGHLIDRGGHRVRPFIVTRDLAFLKCDLCGDKLPRDAFMAHVSEERNEKNEDKSSTLYACSADHAEELAIGRRVERELEKTEADEDDVDQEGGS